MKSRNSIWNSDSAGTIWKKSELKYTNRRFLYINIALYSDNMQLITLFHAHMRHLEEKNSPIYDEDMCKAEIEDTLQIFNVPIGDYIE